MVKPDELSLLFDNHLNNFLFELSNGTSRNVSILDMPGFGNMFHSFEENCSELPWPNQLNMAIYNKLMTTYNYLGSDQWNILIYFECERLRKLWNEYMSLGNFETNDFPYRLKNNTLFDFTNYIKEDLTTFLASYSASFPSTQLQQTTSKLLKKAAKNVFLDSYLDRDIKGNGNYDNLIMDCFHQKPLLSHKIDLSRGCSDFYPILTNNGLCHTFNGIESSKIWNDAEIIKSFNKLFGNYETTSKTFWGSGASKGKVRNVKISISRFEVYFIF